MQDDIKPCPCCGGQALWHVAPELPAYYVACYECDLNTAYVIPQQGGKDEAIRRWNRRCYTSEPEQVTK